MTSFVESKDPVERKPAGASLKIAPRRCLTADCTKEVGAVRSEAAGHLQKLVGKQDGETTLKVSKPV